MIKFERRDYRADQLRLGFEGRHCNFDWRPFERRSPAAQRAYLKLKADLLERGMLRPLVTHRGSVLVGQRRFEIMREAGQQEFPGCVEVTEEVSDWTAADIDRLTTFLDELYPDRKEFMTGAA